jgi:phosphatidylinositol-3-phosphatase
VTSLSDHERRGGDRGKGCPECGTPRASDQRYCLECGARFGSVPAAVAALFRSRARPEAAPAKPPEPPGKKSDGWPHERSSFMPSPRAAAAAVIGMLALGVALGSATDQVAQSAGLSTILLESPPPPPEEEPTPAPAGAEPEPEAAAPEPAATPAAIPEEAPLVEEPLPEEPAPEVPEIPEELPAGMPEVKHVFVVMLAEGGYEETFGKRSASPYLRKVLPTQGEVLPNYFAVTTGVLANQVALLSGQGPTPETAAGCPTYGDVAPGTESSEGQIEGNGCIYPATTKTLFGQLSEEDLRWRAYVEEAEPCGMPGPRNPFVYFHAVIDSPECAELDVALPQLSTDLRLKAEEFPALAYVAANQESIEVVVKEIQSSAAYKDGGMVVITSAQARQEGETADARGCCVYPAYPNLPPPASEEPVTGPTKEAGGGGQVGAVLLSPFVEPGTTSETYFNHYSLLATVEELFELEKVGYAAEPAIAGFDESVFNASS